jgi:hypothetical protein
MQHARFIIRSDPESDPTVTRRTTRSDHPPKQSAVVVLVPGDVTGFVQPLLATWPACAHSSSKLTKVTYASLMRNETQTTKDAMSAGAGPVSAVRRCVLLEAAASQLLQKLGISQAYHKPLEQNTRGNGTSDYS